MRVKSGGTKGGNNHKETVHSTIFLSAHAHVYSQLRKLKKKKVPIDSSHKVSTLPSAMLSACFAHFLTSYANSTHHMPSWHKYKRRQL